MATSLDPAATATPLVPQCHATPLYEVYYDEGTSYLGYVDGDRSDCSSDNAGDDTRDRSDDDSDFEDRLNLKSRVAASPARAQPIRDARRRHDVYSLRVMPAWAYSYIAPPAHSNAEWEQPTTEAANADVGHALMNDVMEQPFFEASESSKPPAPHAAGVMCCYWKQGHCSMGSSCWYAHDGLPSTPCHYGAACRKGHRHLVRANAAPPVPKTDANIPSRYVHEPKAPRPSAPLVNTDMACPHCSEVGGVRTQDFPLFEGNRVRQATRAHCGACMRTFLLA